METRECVRLRRIADDYLDKVVSFRWKDDMVLSAKERHTGMIVIQPGALFFRSGKFSNAARMIVVLEDKSSEFAYKIDLRTIKELPPEDQIVWKLEMI